jgi:DNA-binding transcriptional LysR family regulator
MSSAPRLDFEALRLVDTVARRGSFAAAAAELGKVPSAITHAVRRLESDLDVLLFDRRGYRARLTSAGEALLRDGRPLLAAVEDLGQRLRLLAGGWEGELRIALDSIYPFSALLPALERFYRAAPTRLRFLHEVLGGTWDALVTGRADLAIGAADRAPDAAPLAAGCRSVALGRVRFVFAVAPAHPLARAAEPIGLVELRSHRQVVVGDTSQRMTPRSSGLVGAPDALVVPSMEAKVAAQLAGLGVGYVPEHLAAEALARGALVARRVQAERGERNTTRVHLAWRADARGKALDWWLAELRTSAPRALRSVA